MRTLIDILKEERSELIEELRARTDPSPSVEYSPFNRWLHDQIQEINIAIYEIVQLQSKEKK